MSSRRPDLSIVIPAYREEKRIGNTLDKLAAFLRTDQTLKGKNIEVIVVAADAPDNTTKVVRSKQHLFTRLVLLEPGPKVGKGRDVKHGMLHASGEAVLFMDADLATPLPYISTFYAHHQEGHDVVVATRNLRTHHPNFIRRLISNTGNLLFRMASGVWIEDSQCGFKLFSRHAAQKCFSRLTIMGWGFDMEILAIAKAHNLRSKAHRVEGWLSVPDGTFSEGMFKNSLTTLRDLHTIFWKRLRGAYR